MIDAILIVLDVAVEHGRVRLQPDFMCGARQLEPVVAIDLVVANNVPDAVGENLGAATGHGVEPRFFEFDQHLAGRHLANLREERDLDHGERLEMHLRESLLQARDQIDIVLEWQVGVQAADNVKLRNRFAVAGSSGVPDFFQRHGVGAGGILFAAKGAQAAGGHANIGVIDMAVNVEVGDVAVHPLANVVGQADNLQNVARAVERKSIVSREPLLSHHLVMNWAQARVVGLKGMNFLGAGGVRYGGHLFNHTAASSLTTVGQLGGEPAANLGPWDGLCLAGVQLLYAQGNLALPRSFYVLVLINLFSHGVILPHRASIRSPAMKNRNAIETRPFMVKKAAFTRLRSSCFTNECS